MRHDSRWLGRYIVAACALAWGGAAAAEEPCVERWAEGVFASPGWINDMVTYDDGTGAKLYLAGGFRAIADVQAAFLVAYDGENWTPVGEGLNDEVDQLLVSDDGSGPALYATGRFTASGDTPLHRIAKWDGETWEALGEELADFSISALALHDEGAGAGPQLYAATSDSEGPGHLFRWTGTQWETLLDISFAGIYTLTSWDDGSGPALYIGGSFEEIGGVAAKAIVRWRDGEVTPLGDGLYRDDGRPSVRHTIIHDDGSGEALFVTGWFDGAGSTQAENIARWTGAEWETVDDWVAGNSPPSIRDFATFDDGAGEKLYMAAHHVDGILAWDGVTGELLGEQYIAEQARVLLAADFNGRDLLIATDEEGLVFWDGLDWQTLPEFGHATDTVGAMRPLDLGNGEHLYAAGQLGGPWNNRYYVAYWNGERWRQISGLFGDYTDYNSNHFQDLIAYDSGEGPDLYVTGGFWGAADVDGEIARWDGEQWHPLGTGLYETYVPWGESLAVYDPGAGAQLYVGGRFSHADGVASQNIASWDGEQWHGLGAGLNQSVDELVVADTGTGPRLYAIGGFTTADQTLAVNRIAAWDGTNWHDLDGGLNNSPTGIAVMRADGADVLYVIGDFTTAGGLPSNGFARWDGESWAPAGPQPPGDGITLHAHETPAGQRLFAFSRFFVDGELHAHVWRFEGDMWIRLGRFDGIASETAIFDDGSGPALFVGGAFDEVDGVYSGGIARRNLCDPDDIAADINGDGVVDQMDLGLLLQAYGTCAGDDYYNPDADLTGDDCVDQQDLGLLLQAYGM